MSFLTDAIEVPMLKIQATGIPVSSNGIYQFNKYANDKVRIYNLAKFYDFDVSQNSFTELPNQTELSNNAIISGVGAAGNTLNTIPDVNGYSISSSTATTDYRTNENFPAFNFFSSQNSKCFVYNVEYNNNVDSQQATSGYAGVVLTSRGNIIPSMLMNLFNDTPEYITFTYVNSSNIKVSYNFSDTVSNYNVTGTTNFVLNKLSDKFYENLLLGSNNWGYPFYSLNDPNTVYLDTFDPYGFYLLNQTTIFNGGVNGCVGVGINSGIPTNMSCVYTMQMNELTFNYSLYYDIYLNHFASMLQNFNYAVDFSFKKNSNDYVSGFTNLSGWNRTAINGYTDSIFTISHWAQRINNTLRFFKPGPVGTGRVSGGYYLIGQNDAVPLTNHLYVFVSESGRLLTISEDANNEIWLCEAAYTFGFPAFVRNYSAPITA